jgi:hypothetical protein
MGEAKPIEVSTNKVTTRGIGNQEKRRIGGHCFLRETYVLDVNCLLRKTILQSIRQIGSRQVGRGEETKPTGN